MMKRTRRSARSKIDDSDSARPVSVKKNEQTGKGSR